MHVPATLPIFQCPIHLPTDSTHQAEKFSQLKRASKFLENEAVLKYLHCRPQAFKKLASNLTSYPDFNTNDEDILNLIKLKDGEVVKQELPCTNKPLVTEWIESSADGIFE